MMGEAEKKAVRKARLAGLYANAPRVGPQTVHFDIANACNTRCTTCWHHSPHLLPEHRPTAAWKKERLDFDAFARAFDDVLSLGGLESIILSGMGDPTMNDDLYAMVAHAHRHGIGVTIITNLLRLDVGRLFEAARWPEVPLDLLTSICGVTPDVWQAFHAHPTPRGFETMLARLDALRARGFAPKHVQVINRDNFRELPAMVRFGAEWPAKRVNFKYASLVHGTEAVALGASEVAELADALIPDAMAEARRLGVDTDLPAFAMQVDAGRRGEHETAPIAEVGCFMGFMYARVTVLGELLYCCNTRLGVGHISAPGGFAAAWRGADWQARRDALRQGRYFDGCDQCGKFKENLKWSEKIRGKVAPEVFAGLIGRAGEGR
jgi:MoaA/NifB/PqqE/SkfB family radical SAM enzyme